MLTPTSIRQLLYNPAPLNSFIAKACLRAVPDLHFDPKRIRAKSPS